jgi:hypothetical protein
LTLGGPAYAGNDDLKDCRLRYSTSRFGGAQAVNANDNDPPTGDNTFVFPAAEPLRRERQRGGPRFGLTSRLIGRGAPFFAGLRDQRLETDISPDHVNEITDEADSLGPDEKVMPAASEEEVGAKMDGYGARDVEGKDQGDQESDV